LILPFLEQIGGLEMLDLPAITYTSSPSTSFNQLAFNGFRVPAFICPSSPCPPMIKPEDAPPDISILCGNYVGIMGASNSSTDFTDPTGAGRVCNIPAAAPINQNFGGYAASNGVLYPVANNPAVTPTPAQIQNKRHLLRLQRILDGTSNTLMLGEQSDYGIDPGVGPAAPNRLHDIRMPKRAGVWTGASTGITFGQPTCASTESASIITVRWPIGQKTRVSFNDGIARYGWNTPIQSAHPGGALTARCDGGTAFLKNNMSFDVLKWLCIRDDGKAISVP
jgi:hypothetical protein